MGDRENEAGSWYIQGLERSTSDKEPIIDSSRPRVKLRLLDDQKKACASFVDNEMRAMSVVNLYNTKDMDFAGNATVSRVSSFNGSMHNFSDDLHKENEFKLASAENSDQGSYRSSINFDQVMDEDKSTAKVSIHVSPPNSGNQSDHSIHTDHTDCPKNPFGDSQSCNTSLYFRDGNRSVDFVLVWKQLLDDSTSVSIEEAKMEKRRVFQQNLLKEGLEIEEETIEEEVMFIKIHAPLEVLRRYSEILKLRMPMKEIPGLTTVRTRAQSLLRKMTGVLGTIGKKFIVEEKHFPPISHRFTAVYSRDKEYLFDIKQTCHFTAAIRSRIVQFILDRKRFSSDELSDYAFGIERLIGDGVYLAAYPLHDGDLMVPGSMRNLLFRKWASMKRWFRYQPLDYIKEYFGVKIGLYFAWLGYYTYMLLLASIVGLISFIYSFRQIKENKVSQQICYGNDTIIMCPLCDNWCDYWKIKETCIQAKVTSLFDNPMTVFFAIFMSFWATLFLELWKRYSAEITHRWDLTGFDVHEEHPRPQYLARLAHVRRKKLNVVTNTVEPEIPFWRMKLPAALLSFSVVLLLIALAVATVLGVVLYRMSVLASLSVYGDQVSTSYAILFTTATAATINLLLIVIFNWIYEYLAEYLTELELLRTQTEFDDSLTLKIYLLQFVNYYASIFYIAFFKGRFTGHPRSYNRFFNYRQEECGLGGCLMELMIQLAIIMIGKQTMNAVVESFYPLLQKYLNSLKLRLGKQKNRSLKGKGQRWLNDLKLVEFGPRGLFPEYLEMVLQYGFVTLFVVAFPLAPLFALINNIFEMRLDAKKLLTHYRRPVSQRVRNIGVWFRILDSIGKLSVITNGFIIAFTSDIIPRLMYSLFISPDHSLDGYLNHTLAYFKTADLKPGTLPFVSNTNVTMCRYQDYRDPPGSLEEYERNKIYWMMMAARLVFVVLFENFVAIVMIVVKWAIPDMSQDLKDQIRREAYITNEIVIKQEALRTKRDREDLSHRSNWENLMHKKLSGSELDLFIHGEHEAKNRKLRYKQETEDFLTSEGRSGSHNNLVMDDLETKV